MECTVLTKPIKSFASFENQSKLLDVERFALPDQLHHISVHHKILEISDLWHTIAPNKTFFSIPFLNLIENHPPKGLIPVYLLVWKEHRIIGIILLQEKLFRLDQSLNNKEGEKGSWSKLLFSIRKSFSKLIRSKLIICGNVLLTGEYGYYFNQSEISHPETFQKVEEAICTYIKSQKSWRMRFMPILMKDFYEDKKFGSQKPKTEFTEFSIQPNMIMKIDANWNHFDDYLAALKSKYRVRAKRAFKKMGDQIVKRKLNAEDVIKYQNRMYALYLDIAQDAGFNLFELPKDYFRQMMSFLDDKIEMYGYFLDDKMLGYYTIIFDDDYMEAHYLGYDKSYNTELQLYLNMLYDLVRIGIESKSPKIQFARTALEIKSSIGAVPHEMQCYVKHTFSPINVLAGTLLNYFTPSNKWIPRSPFR